MENKGSGNRGRTFGGKKPNFGKNDRAFAKDGNRSERGYSAGAKDSGNRGERPRGTGAKPQYRGGKAQGGRFNRGKGAPKPAMPRREGPSPRDLALRAFRDVMRNNAFASQALDRQLQTAPNMADNDRRLAAGIFYFTLENRLRIEHCLTKFVKTEPEQDAMEIMDIAAAQLLFMDKIPDHAAVNEAVEMTRRAKKDSLCPMVNGVLHNLIRARDAGELALPDRETEPKAYLSEKYSVSLPLAERLYNAYGIDVAEKIVSWTPDRRCDVIRANRMRQSDAELEQYLTAQGIDWKKGMVEGAYRVFGAGRLSELDGYKKGLFSIQGESSMLAAQAVGVKTTQQVLDACAAPGGKSALMAEAMRGTGRVYSWDLHEHRVELIRAAARRLGLENIRPQENDASKFNKNLEYEMDAVLVDAPCTGVGVMGAKPDIRYNLTEETMEALPGVQKAILDNCARYVRPGGTLVYSTCTILPEENEAQVRAFLETHPAFEPMTDNKWLPEELRGLYKDGMIQILQGRDGIEGFFIARMRRKAIDNV